MRGNTVLRSFLIFHFQGHRGGGEEEEVDESKAYEDAEVLFRYFKVYF